MSWLSTAGVCLGADVFVDKGTLRYVENPGEVNVVDMEPAWTEYAVGVNVFEDQAGLRAGDGCILLMLGWAQCWAAIEAIEVDVGYRNDLVTLSELELPARVWGGRGADLLETGKAPDDVNAGAGVDTILAGGGSDELAGGEGGDLIKGGANEDAIEGGSGVDALYGGAGDSDQLIGDEGADLLDGGSGDDVINGGSGDDALIDRQGEDRLRGGDGNDLVLGIGTSDRVNCGAGQDDRVSSRAGDETGCADAKETDAGIPAVWPPQRPQRRGRAKSRRAKVAVIRKPPPRVIAKVRRKGNASYLSVRIKKDQIRSYRIRLKLFDKNGERLRYKRRHSLKSRNWRQVRSPRPPRRAFKAKGKCC